MIFSYSVFKYRDLKPCPPLKQTTSQTNHRQTDRKWRIYEPTVQYSQVSSKTFVEQKSCDKYKTKLEINYLQDFCEATSTDSL